MLLSGKQSSSKSNFSPNHRRDKFSFLEKNSQYSSANMGSQKLHFSSGKHTNQSVNLSVTASDPITAQHRDNVAVLYDEWEKVKAELNRNENDGGDGIRGVTEYVERTPNPKMQDFQPFDLEEFWGQKQLKNLTS